jgi:hypothetical protein
MVYDSDSDPHLKLWLVKNLEPMYAALARVLSAKLDILFATLLDATLSLVHLAITSLLC